MERQQVIELLKHELPALLEDDAEIRQIILALSRQHFAERKPTNDRFESLLEELKKEREHQDKKWEEHRVALEKERERQDKKWEVQNKDQNKKWEEQNKNWDKVHEEILRMAEKHESSIGALGSRWGISSENAFRDGLASPDIFEPR